jgi:hypothetical protein
MSSECKHATLDNLRRVDPKQVQLVQEMLQKKGCPDHNDIAIARRYLRATDNNVDAAVNRIIASYVKALLPFCKTAGLLYSRKQINKQ